MVICLVGLLLTLPVSMVLVLQQLEVPGWLVALDSALVLGAAGAAGFKWKGNGEE